jgi:transposase
MRSAPYVELSPSERERLEDWRGSLPSSGRLAGRVRIVLEAAEGKTNSEIAGRVGVHPGTVARWRGRFLVNGIDGLSREGPRSGHPTKIPKELVERVLERTLHEHPPDGSAWTTRTLAQSLRVNHMLVHRVWAAYRLANDPRRAIPDPATATAHLELAGVYARPPASAVVFSVEARPARSPARTPLPSIVPNVTGRPEFASPLESTDDLLAALREIEDKRPISRPLRASSVAFLVFLRSVQSRASPSARLDLVLDRPMAELEPRVRDWLSVHDRFRVFTTEPGESWVRAVGSWLGRWESARVDPESLRAIPGWIASLTPGTGGGTMAAARSAWTCPPTPPPRPPGSIPRIGSSSRPPRPARSPRPAHTGRGAMLRTD